MEKKRAGRRRAEECEGESQALAPVDATRYRALAARANFLAIDRGDIMYCAKELTRQMSNPKEKDRERLVRLGRYLKGHPRSITWYKFQGDAKTVETHSDTDWAGCKRTRRSTTGGFALLGKHLIKMWCKTQAIVALRSAEAELYGLVRAFSETLGLLSLGSHLGLQLSGRVLGDASAALAVIQRQGLGKLRHIDTNYLLVQEKAARGELEYKNVKGTENGADIFTKALTWEEIRGHMARLGAQIPGKEEEAEEVPHVGARPVGVQVRRALQQLGIQDVRGLRAWTRTDLGSATTRTTMRGGPAWGSVVARISSRAFDGQILSIERVEDIPRALEHARVSGGPVDLQTTLVYAADGSSPAQWRSHYAEGECRTLSATSYTRHAHLHSKH